jgi:hypothetical protein
MEQNQIDPALFYQQLQKYVDWNIENLYQSNDNDLLFKFCKNILGYHIPRKKVCPDHVAPFDFVSDSFYDRKSKFLVVANRNGGKTQNFGIINGLDATCKKRCEIASVGAIEDQAKKCYKYTTDIIKKPYFKHLLDTEPRISLTELNNGSEISVLPGTMAGVNGPHPQKTNFDEVELTQWKILMEFLSMAKSTKDVPATTRITSTRKFSHGPMQRLIDEREKRGFNFYMWCIWETIEACSDARSGVVPTTLVIPDSKNDQLHHHTVYSHNKDDHGKAYGIDIIRTNREKFTGCLACPLVEVCLTKAKHSDGYYDLKDTIDKFTGLDRETWDAQWECKKPGKSGLVYGEFDEVVHVISQESFKYNPNYKCIAAQDFGYEDPAGTIFMQFLPNGDAVIFDELYIRRTQTPVLIQKYWLPKQRQYHCEAWIADTENADAISQMESEGLPVIGANKELINGIDRVRSWLRTADGYVRLYITSNCVNVIKELNAYRYPENGGNKPIDRDNHLMDPIRYIFNTLDEIGGDAKVEAEEV